MFGTPIRPVDRYIYIYDIYIYIYMIYIYMIYIYMIYIYDIYIWYIYIYNRLFLGVPSVLRFFSDFRRSCCGASVPGWSWGSQAATGSRAVEKLWNDGSRWEVYYGKGWKMGMKSHETWWNMRIYGDFMVILCSSPSVGMVFTMKKYKTSPHNIGIYIYNSNIYHSVKYGITSTINVIKPMP